MTEPPTPRRTGKRWLAFAPLIVLAALAVLFAGYALNHDPKVAPSAMVGKPAPALTLPALTGGPDIALTEAANDGVLINFFASWCAPCIEENPALLALEAQGVRIVGVAWKDEPDKSRAFLTRLGDPFAAIAIDRDNRAGVEFGVSGVPETFAVKDGRIVAKHAGALTPADAERLLEAMR